VTVRRVLIGGIGNVFFGDDAFGVEVARGLAKRRLPEGVRVVDFGIRGFDLACALAEGWDEAILVDAAPRGGTPGTLYVIEPKEAEPSAVDLGAPGIEGHGLDPVRVLALARSFGEPLPRVRVLGCEPLHVEAADEGGGLSDAVRAAVAPAIDLALALAIGPQGGSDA
jgi:hydrogenase maturation protease